jgi:hypothetical protein
MIRAPLAILALAVCLAGFPGCTALAQEVTGMKLEDSGFKMREANTPQKMTRLKSLPARTFVKRTRKGIAYFIFADPDYCKCAYIGNQQAMDNYRIVTTPASGLPNYTGPIDSSKPSGVRTEQEMVTDMGDDGTQPEDEDDIFHPGLLTIPLR